MITIVAKLQANPGKEEELKANLTKMVEAVKANEAGAVVRYSLHTSDSDPTLFLFYEQYTGQPISAALADLLLAGRSSAFPSQEYVHG